MSVCAENNYEFKGIPCVKLETEKYLAVVAPKMGGSVLRLRDKENDGEIFRYKEETTAEEIDSAREVWGLPTLYLPNRFDKGVLKTSDACYQFPINETLFDNFIHGWVHKREHTVELCETQDDTAVVKLSFTFGKDDPMYQYFPLDFIISYTFSLSDESGLVQEITLKNLSDKMLPVSICTHTCINAPVFKAGKESSLKLFVPVGKKCELDDRCLPTEKLLPLNDWDKEYLDGKRPTLQNISNDMYTAVYKGKNASVVVDCDTGLRLYNEVSEQFRFWNMWNDEGQKGYFCPEPMTAMINAPNLSLPGKTSGYSELAKDQTFSCSQRFYTE